MQWKWRSVGIIWLGLVGLTGCGMMVKKQGLYVSGHALRYQGRDIMLRGVAVGDPFLGRAERPLDDYLRIARKWNANAVRISIHPTVWKTSTHLLVLRELRRQAEAARTAGLFVIFDWHAIGWPDGYYEKPRGDGQTPEDLYDSRYALAEDFWTRMAREFGRDGTILFELWNEPVRQADEYAGGDTWRELKPYYERLTAAVRRAGAENVLLATGSQWAYDLRGIRRNLLADRNTAYAWHVYAGHDGNDPRRWAGHLDGLQTVRPVVVTEWGFENGSSQHYNGTAENFGAPFVRYFLDGLNLHSTAWCWHSGWGPAMLADDWQTPTEFGNFVLQYLQCHSAQRP